MVLKTGFVAAVPDGDPKRHRASIKTSKYELTAVMVELGNLDQAVNVCKDLVQNEGVQSFILCPGFSHEEVAEIKKAVGERVAVSVARGDVPSTMIVGEILAKEGWFPEGH